jgi:hypothetical protein
MANVLTSLLLVFLAQGAAMAVEEPRFTIETRTAQYDIRAYASMVVAETRVEAGFDVAGNRGFKLLADYIFGNNQSRTKVAEDGYSTQQGPSKKIAMTAPVGQVQTPSGFLIQFTMPVGATLTSLPIPKDARVHLRELPARRIAVASYSGSWSEARYQEHRKELVSALAMNGIRTTGEPVFARFNSPFQLWFLRRNEIWIEVLP